MRLRFILTICVLLSFWLNRAQSGEPKGADDEIVMRTRDFDSDPAEWRQRGSDIKQVLSPPMFDFDKVGYRIGAFDLLSVGGNSPSGHPSLSDSTGSQDFGFGSQTLNWMRNGVEPAAVLLDPPIAVLIDPPSEIEQLEFQDGPIVTPEPSSEWGLQTPEQLFAPPLDPTMREYTAGDWKDAIPKTLWQEYSDWFHSRIFSWTERLELGGSFLEGNTNQEAFNTAVKFSRDTKFTSTQINIGGNHAQSKMTTTANRWFGDTTTDFKREGNWLYFVRSLHEYDQFTNLDYRGTASFGSGYRFFNEENRKLIIRYGPGVTQEIFHSPRVVRTSPDLFMELETKWLLGPRIVFEEKATLHPNITNFGMLRVLNTTGFLIPLDDQKRWNLKVGFRYEYNGSPNAGRLSNDFATNVNIVYSRK